jgi:serine/threonine-protein phosphatase 2A regulatory subunit B''
MSYYDFVWFLISEEDKRNQTSVEYWFRVLDIDGDGVLSMFELEYFYNEQIEQMRERQIEYMPFNDLLCQVREKNALCQIILSQGRLFAFFFV